MAAKLVDDFRHVEVGERQRLRWNGAKDGADAVQVTKHVDAETRNLRDLVGKVGGVVLLEVALRCAIHDLEHAFANGVDRQGFLVHDLQIAVNSCPNRIARYEVQVGRAALQGSFQVLVDLHQLLII